LSETGGESFFKARQELAEKMLIEKPTAEQPVVFTAQSKLHFYCRDAI
jgi:hypothetical protein